MPFPFSYLLFNNYTKECAEKFIKAKNIGKQAELKYVTAKQELENNSKNIKKSLIELGKIKILASTNQMQYLLHILQQKNKNHYSHISIYDKKNFIKEKQNIEALVMQSLELKKIRPTSVSIILCAFGAYSAVGTVVSSSTSTVFALLSAIAATNPTLAWLGGSNLTANDFVATSGKFTYRDILKSALAVGGFEIAEKVEHAISDAYSYEANVNMAIAKIDIINSIMNNIRTAIAEQTAVIIEISEKFDQVKVSSIDDPRFARMYTIGKYLRDVLMVPVLSDDGTVNPYIYKKCSYYLKICREI